MQGNREANGSPRSSLSSSSPPAFAGLSPPYTLYSLSGMTDYFASEQQCPHLGDPSALQSGWTKEQARAGEGRQISPPTHLLPPPSWARSPAQPRFRSPPLRPILASPRVVLSLSLSSSPPAPFPVSSSRLLCCPLGAHVLRSLGAARRRVPRRALPLPLGARAPRGPAGAPSARRRLEGRQRLPAAAHGAARRGPALAAALRIAVLRKGWRGKERGAAIDTALGPLKGAAWAGYGRQRRWSPGARPCALPRGARVGCCREDKGGDLRTPVHSRRLTLAATGPDIAREGHEYT